MGYLDGGLRHHESWTVSGMTRRPRPARRARPRVFSESLLGASWEDRDGHRILTTAALIGLPVAILLAVFGLPPVNVHGPLHYLGIMGPTCGITRGVMWFTRGELATAWQYNPLSLLMVPGAVLVLGRAVYGWWTGRWLRVALRRNRWLIAIVVLGTIMLTIRQQLQGDLLS